MLPEPNSRQGQAAEKDQGEAFMAARNEASAKSEEEAKLRAVPEAKAEAQMKRELLQKKDQGRRRSTRHWQTRN